ncbi:Uncharacterised protein [Mycolicibacterium vanbaalenii]|uniref:Uncharacterized protein n=1 Tax=Mycolicibacterium vanbaalenii TaxID=110539 RepID=A0A5S9QWN3_MYCVN|nr:Uncharacterised protein [Mycolicibacterium vanbaalenii]
MTAPPPGPWPPQQPPPPGFPPGPPQWGPSPPWGQQPPPQNGGNRSKWILGGLVLLVVVVVTVVAILLFTRGSSDTSPPPGSSSTPSSSIDNSEVASANDDGPVNVVTDDPTCDAWTPIAQTLFDQQEKGWENRDASVPASSWTVDQREMHMNIAAAMNSAADATSALVKLTPHRVMRELYQQTIAYWRTYAATIPEYTAADNHLAAVANGLSSTVNWICGAISYGSAAARGMLVTPGVAPLEVAPIGDINSPQPFIESGSPLCTEWHAMVAAYRDNASDWMQNADPGIPASQWPPSQQRLFTSMVTVMGDNAGEIQQLGLRSKNPVWRDFANLIAKYRFAYVQAIPTYVPSDNYLDSVASELVVAIDEACYAAGM